MSGHGLVAEPAVRVDPALHRAWASWLLPPVVAGLAGVAVWAALAARSGTELP